MAGKALRSSGPGAALGYQTGRVVDQAEEGQKTNEISMIKTALDPLDRMGMVVTVEALHTQTETARYLVEAKNAHDVSKINKNQSTLDEAIAAVALVDYTPPTNPG